MRSADELRELVEDHLGRLELSAELGGLRDAMRYTVEAGGKRIRPVLCLATAEAAGAEPEHALHAATAIELVHTFSLVHDDLPALDDDAVRRGRASAHVRFGEAVAILAGDALLAEAMRLALSYPTPAVARELAEATIGMIGGQYLDVTEGTDDLTAVNQLKTGRLFEASVGCALWVAGVPEREQAGWRRFGREVGLLFQIADDLLDGDGYAVRHGVEEARRLADSAEQRAREALSGLIAETATLAEILGGVAARAV